MSSQHKFDVQEAPDAQDMPPTQGQQDAFSLTPPNPQPKAIGYTVLRSGSESDREVCLLVPHVSPMRSASLDSFSRRLDVGIDGAGLVLTDIPADVVTLLCKHPKNVLLVSVDTLSRPRSSIRAFDLLAASA